MKRDALEMLRAANPVLELPPVLPVERLYPLVEHKTLGLQGHPRERKPRLFRAGGFVVVATVALVTAVGLILTTGGASGPGVNVAAAAYAATSPGDGIIEAVYIQHFASHRVPALTIREWLQASTGRRRVRNTLPGSGHFDMVETAIAPGIVENWESADRAGNVIHRDTNTAPVPLQQPGEGVALFRKLYQEGSLKLVGHERREGRLLWKLEVTDEWAKYSNDAAPTPISTDVVLVDPKTYLPVVQRQINLTIPGHPVTGETDLVRFTRLRANPKSESLLDLQRQHPKARVLTRALIRPQE